MTRDVPVARCFAVTVDPADLAQAVDDGSLERRFGQLGLERRREEEGDGKAHQTSPAAHDESSRCAQFTGDAGVAE